MQQTQKLVLVFSNLSSFIHSFASFTQKQNNYKIYKVTEAVFL